VAFLNVGNPCCFFSARPARRGVLVLEVDSTRQAAPVVVFATASIPWLFWRWIARRDCGGRGDSRRDCRAESSRGCTTPPAQQSSRSTRWVFLPSGCSGATNGDRKSSSERSDAKRHRRTSGVRHQPAALGNVHDSRILGYFLAALQPGQTHPVTLRLGQPLWLPLGLLNGHGDRDLRSVSSLRSAGTLC